MTDYPRVVEPEKLDSLSSDDPRAVKARTDLRRLNFLMGNARWIHGMVASHAESARRGIVELGAGDGLLLTRFAKQFPATGCDLAPRPPGLPSELAWLQGDLFSHETDLAGGILIANLFLHHLSPLELARIGEIAERFERLVFVEPHRSRRALGLATALLPFVSEVTRHDMPVSIRAGFVTGELPSMMCLSSRWSVKETSNWRGAHRLLASRSA